VSTDVITIRLKRAAYRLALDGVLSDPSDDEILLAAAELAEDPRDLSTLSYNEKEEICAVYDRHAWLR
jgi:hypothetical protein